MVNLNSWLPDGGENIFAQAKAAAAAAQKRGIEILDLSVGVIQGPAPFIGRRVAAKYSRSKDSKWHSYQDSNFPEENYPWRYRKAYDELNLEYLEGIAAAPLRGIKDSIPYAIYACGKKLRDSIVQTMTNPGYPTPAYACASIGQTYKPLRLNPHNGFRPDVNDIAKETKLLLLNMGHNPSGSRADIKFWQDLCEVAADRKIRVVNDNPYEHLVYAANSCSFAQIAKDYADLSWIEFISASKLGFAGWRIALAYGSSDYIGDVIRIKNNLDSGWYAPAAMGVLAFLESESGPRKIAQMRNLFYKRNKILGDVLANFGIKSAIEPQLGFFRLLEKPSKGWGQRFETAADFSRVAVSEGGLLTIPFDPYIRLSVSAFAVEKKAVREALEKVLTEANLSY